MLVAASVIANRNASASSVVTPSPSSSSLTHSRAAALCSSPPTNRRFCATIVSALHRPCLRQCAAHRRESSTLSGHVKPTGQLRARRLSNGGALHRTDIDQRGHLVIGEAR